MAVGAGGGGAAGKPPASKPTTAKPAAKPAAAKPAAAPAVKKATAAELAAKYGYAATLFQTSPELQKLIAEATKGQWTKEQFQARFMATSWYRNQAESYKRELAMRASNPEEMYHQRRKIEANIAQMAASAGFTIPTDRASTMAALAYRWDWTDAELRRAIAAEMQFNPEMGGDVGADVQQVKSLAAQYGVNVTDQMAFDMAKQVFSGNMTEEGMRQWAVNQAKSMFPGLSDDIDRGLTVQQIASSYIEAKARILETDPNQIDLRTDSDVKQALGYLDPSSGKQAAMPIWMYEQKLKQSPQWLQTKNAHEDLTKVGSKVLRDMGMMA